MMRRISLGLCALVAMIGLARANVIVETVHFPSSPTPPCWTSNNNSFTTKCVTIGTGSCGNSSSNYTGTCIVYVENGSTGSCTAQTPPVLQTPPANSFQCGTISAGIALLRATSADWLLLKMGDTFSNQDFLSACKLNGISATAPLLFSYYGSGNRPLVEPTGNGYMTSGSTECAGGGNYIAFIGIEFYAPGRDPGNAAYNYTAAATDVWGIYLINSPNVMTWFLIEDCKFSFFGHNVDLEPFDGGNTFLTRRNIILNAWSPNAYTYRTSNRAQGMYTNNGTANGAETTYQNLFDSNGWNATLNAPTPVSCSNANPTTCTWGGTLAFMPGADASLVAFGGTLPSGLTAYTLYCTINTNTGAGTFQITPVNPSSTGTYDPEDATAPCPYGSPIGVTSSVSGTTVQWADAGQNEFDRNLYDDNPGTDFEQNISTRSSSSCFQFRGGATMRDNVCSDSPSGGVVGSTTCVGACPTSIINDNSWLNGIDGTSSSVAYYNINASTNSWGFQIQANGADITNNVTANSTIGTSAAWAWDISAGYTGITLTGNPISDWGTCPSVIDADSNTISGNTCTSSGFSTATIGAYNAQLADCASLAGGCAATTAAFIKSAAARAPGTWPAELAADAVNTYVRNLFGLSP